MRGARLQTASSQLCPSLLRHRTPCYSPPRGGEGITFQSLKKKINTKLPLLSTPLPGYASERREVPAGSVLQGTRDIRRSVYCGTAELPSRGPGLRSRRRSRLPRQPRRRQPQAGIAPRRHRAPAPPTTPAPPRPPTPCPRRETCNKRRGSRGAHWPDRVGRGGTGRDRAGPPLKGAPPA